ncbi:MAG TPA: DNA-3-methyladenine glycosylase [Candidatus Chromulinivoraceae bacterium]|nr:DNA-3-methyladenine glycosylase [Candidatus Chromulinivoraceae bacterium]
MSFDLQRAADHLAANDPILAPIVATSPLPGLVPHTDYYQALVNSIIGQQLSVKAAATIKKRFADLFGTTFPAPEQIIASDDELLKSAGLSRPKVAYIKDLAMHVLDGSILFDHFGELSNDEILAELISVKGIGEWTVHMFLMFCMGRLDVLPTGDLGVRSGIKQLYGLDNLPTPEIVKEIATANRWHPYESAASWYIWRSLDNEPL